MTRPRRIPDAPLLLAAATALVLVAVACGRVGPPVRAAKAPEAAPAGAQPSAPTGAQPSAPADPDEEETP